MKILLLGKCLDGGTGTFFNSMLKLNSIRKIDMIPAVLEKPTYVIPPKNVKIQYFSNYSIYPERYEFSLRTFSYLIKEFFWLRSLVKRVKPNLIISIDFHCSLLSEILKFITKSEIKTITTFHNNLEQVLENKSTPSLRYLLLTFARFFIKKSDRVICVTDELSKNIDKLLKLKRASKSIYNGIKLNKLNYEYKRKVNNDVISIARFFEQKDHVTLLKSFAIVVKRIKSARLYLVGDGPLKNKLLTLSKKIGIENKVIFAGWANNPDKLLEKSAIFVLSTKREGFGYAIIEAMSIGLPTIVTNVKFGPSEILGNGRYGILSPVGNYKKMADSICDLLSDKNLYKHFSKLSIKRSKKFNVKKMINEYLDIINTFN